MTCSRSRCPRTGGAGRPRSRRTPGTGTPGEAGRRARRARPAGRGTGSPPRGDAARSLPGSPAGRPGTAGPSRRGPRRGAPGHIEGALGRIRIGEYQAGGLRRRLITFLAIIGPGLIVMVGDNDAGGVSTYAQAGQNYGYSLLWTLILLIP